MRWSFFFFWSETESARATRAEPSEMEHATTSPAAVSVVAGRLTRLCLICHIGFIGTTGPGRWGGPDPVRRLPAVVAGVHGGGVEAVRARSDAQVAPQGDPRCDGRQHDDTRDDERSDVEDVGLPDEGRVGE